AIVLAGSIPPQTDSTAEIPQQVHHDRREKPRPIAHHRREFCSTGARTADPAFAPATLSLAPSPCRGCQDPERTAPRWRGDKRRCVRKQAYGDPSIRIVPLLKCGLKRT